jgi:hypothetical protein
MFVVCGKQTCLTELDVDEGEKKGGSEIFGKRKKKFAA